MPVKAKDMKWYVVAVAPGKDNNVKTTIKKLASRKNLAHYFGKVLICKHQVLSYDPISGRPSMQNRKRYPGYLIIQALHTLETFTVVSSVKGVIGYLPIRDSNILDPLEMATRALLPTPLNDEEAAHALLVSGKKEQLPGGLHLKAGDKCNIIGGLFKGIEQADVISVSQDPEPIISVGFLFLGSLANLKLKHWQVAKSS